ncbi:hypothetical protein C8F04DRAFT_946800 [Mycena alexandri]|uniref:HMG box domain-containing protein n=1 Tax=Mycena alexandri TaxID=1745969 RepID=A0AAD6X9Q2_9AGAR|nr:hypothetical protein C8F04DRAFT_946800 [Mycena alexandri]
MSSLDFSDVSFPASSAFTFSVTSSPGGADGGNESIPSASTGGRGGRRAAARAPSYIPRPPNAFILFRSSFIRSQNVPGRVEGNHSTLSKIIGKYWHALAPAERARWEDKARLAQAEHRRRYPDWRFRPGNGKVSFLRREFLFPARLSRDSFFFFFGVCIFSSGRGLFYFWRGERGGRPRGGACLLFTGAAWVQDLACAFSPLAFLSRFTRVTSWLSGSRLCLRSRTGSRSLPPCTASP